MTTVKHWTAALLLATFLPACGPSGGGGASAPPPGLEDDSFDLDTAVTLMQLCLESYQMLTDFEGGQTFTLPAPYTLQAQFLTEEHYDSEGLNGKVPIGRASCRERVFVGV